MPRWPAPDLLGPQSLAWKLACAWQKGLSRLAGPENNRAPIQQPRDQVARTVWGREERGGHSLTSVRQLGLLAHSRPRSSREAISDKPPQTLGIQGATCSQTRWQGLQLGTASGGTGLREPKRASWGESLSCHRPQQSQGLPLWIDKK